MTDINNLFFELIRVAIGNAGSLSHTPSMDEWGELYAMAKKQSLVGICFAGVQRLQGQHLSPPVMLYMQWMGLAAKIQQKNECVNRQCAELQKRIADVGFKTAIIKGQGIASLYGDDLKLLRQPGDIDIFIEGGRTAASACVTALGLDDEKNDHHVHMILFDNSAVELHFAASPLIIRTKNCFYQKWIKAHALSNCRKVTVTHGIFFDCASDYFNLVYVLSHIHKHLLSEGLGFRQLMDYYFVLTNNKLNEVQLEDIKSVVEKIGMTRFAKALMWVMYKVFGLEQGLMPWPMDNVRGEYVLQEVLRGGNFGYYDDSYKRDKKASHLKRYCQVIVNGFRHIKYFPCESLWNPIDYFMMFMSSH